MKIRARPGKIGFSRGWLGLLAAFLLAPLASAQVIEIGDDGTVTHHDGPAVYLGPEAIAQPILPPAAAAPPIATPSYVPASTVTRAIDASSAAHNVSRDLAFAVAWHESRLRPDVVSSKGAVGVMQLMPATARYLRVDPYDPVANVEGGVTFLASLLQRYKGDVVKSLAAYSAGPGAVDRYGGVPPYRETQNYVASILNSLASKVTR